MRGFVLYRSHTILVETEAKQLLWFGHLHRMGANSDISMGDHRLKKKMNTCQTWGRNIQQGLKEHNLTKDLCSDRAQWR